MWSSFHVHSFVCRVSLLQVVTDTLEDLISKAIDTSKADYAVITGTQIHTGQNVSGVLMHRDVNDVTESPTHVVCC